MFATSLLASRARQTLPLWRRRVLVVVVVLVVGVVGTGLLALVSLRGAQADLLAARAAALEGRDALLEQQDASAARDAFQRSEASFLRGRDRLSGRSVAIAARVGGAGGDVDALTTMAHAGALLAGAGIRLSSALVGLPGGLAALAPTGGRIPLEPIERLAGPVAEAADRVERASTLVARIPREGLDPRVADVHTELRGVLGQIQLPLAAGEALTAQLPALLGADGPRRYFFGASNPAELRGTGGFLGAYAILTVDRGRLRLGDFSATQDLENLPVTAVTPPTPEFARRYDRYGGAGFWLNINMTPDFPSAAVAIERLYEQVSGQALDGVIVGDPFALQALLAATGPADVPGIGEVSADDVIELLTVDAYEEFSTNDERKRVLGAVAAGVLGRVLRGEGDDPVAVGRALASAAGDGHLLLHAVEPDVQAALATAGVDGALAAPPAGAPAGDFLSVVANNAAGNKLDTWLERSIRYEVDLGGEGFAAGAATVELVNQAPSGLSDYVTGAGNGLTPIGDNLTLLSVYCATGCALRDAAVEGAAERPQADSELGHPVFTSMVPLPAGEPVSLTYSWTVADAWAVDGDRARYRWTFAGQTAVSQGQVDLVVAPPPGWAVTPSDDYEIRDGSAVWQGPATADATLEVGLTRDA